MNDFFCCFFPLGGFFLFHNIYNIYSFGIESPLGADIDVPSKPLTETFPPIFGTDNPFGAFAPVPALFIAFEKEADNFGTPPPIVLEKDGVEENFVAGVGPIPEVPPVITRFKFANEPNPGTGAGI